MKKFVQDCHPERYTHYSKTGAKVEGSPFSNRLQAKAFARVDTIPQSLPRQLPLYKGALTHLP